MSDYNIHALLLDNDKLWIGTFSQGVDILDLKTGEFSNYHNKVNDLTSVPDNSIYAFLKDSKNNIYVGTEWGLSRYNRESDSFSLVREIGAMAHIFDIIEDSYGIIWVATYNAGVFCYDPLSEVWSHYTYEENNPNSIVGDRVISLFEDKNNTVWIGTEGWGMCSFDRDTKTFVPFDSENKILPNQVIYSIEQDESDDFWISSNTGLIRINPYTKANRKVFTKADGLQRNQFNYSSSLQARDGKMYFGGINGFNTFYPREFVKNTYVPNVRITEFRLFNKIVDVNTEGSPLHAPIYNQEELVLNHDQNTFSFSFVSLSYQAPDKNLYCYYMEGIDKTWNFTEGGLNTAYYTNLSPGNYTFRVKGANNDNIWNEEERVLEIKIMPPFLQSNLAYFFYFLFVTAGFSFLFRKRVQKSRKT
ncbi:MAG: triple tyrosine motif-containing protein, partial [Bacteroidales bacterium]|nr:triple tyrosine motif-containing protein [Bacteroidales bacterium]